MSKGHRTLGAFHNTVWCVERDKLEQIAQVVARRHAGHPKLTAAEYAAIQRDKTPASRRGAVAVVPLFGVMAQRMDMLTAMSGGTSTEQFARAITALADDDTISAIVINCESPGGSVAYLPEAVAAVRYAASKKPVRAVANSLMCSAAYALASAADSITATQMAFVGALNAIMARVDVSAADEREGIKYHFITGGDTDNKAEGSPHFPASEEELAHLQANVDAAYRWLNASVAEHRGMSAEAVEETFGQGRAMIAERALEVGMIDSIGTLEDVIADLASGKQSRSGARAETPVVTLAATGATLHIDASNLNTVSSLTITGGNGNEAIAFRVNDVVDAIDAGGAAPMDDESPATETAPVAEESTMADQVTAPSPGPDVNALLTAERARIADIRALSAVGATAEQINAWVDDGTTYADASKAALAAAKNTHEATPGLRAGTDRAHRQPFASFGEQLQAVVLAQSDIQIPGLDRASMIGRLHEMQAAATGHSATVGSDGGFLVGTQVEQGLMKRAYDQSVLASRCQMTPIGANADGLETFAIKESSRATGSRFGGVRAYRTAEAETVTASKLGLEKWELRLEDLMAVTYLTERLLQDAGAMQAEVEQAFGDEMAFVLDDEIYRGSGAGQCLGVKNATAWIEVAKETSQVAATVVARNILKMWARVWARSRQNGAWFYNQALEAQLPALSIEIKNVAGTENVGGYPIFMPAGGISGQQYASLFGRPLIPIEQADAPGTAGDISFLDLSQYRLIQKGGTQVDESMHVRFLYNERAFRFVTRVNGKPKWSAPLTPYKGSDTLSPFVGIAVRS